MSMSAAALARAGYLTGTVPTDLADREKFDRMVEAATYRPNVFTFARDLSDTVTVSLGYAVYDRGVHYVAYEVAFSATGEIYQGMDFLRDQHAPVRDQTAAVALLGLLGRVENDTALIDFAAGLLPGVVAPSQA